jgi:hypothetical protein
MIAIGRVHRIGQTRETHVHRYIVQDTVEDFIYRKRSEAAQRNLPFCEDILDDTFFRFLSDIFE